MSDVAKKRLSDEMSKVKNPYVKVIGEYLLAHLEANPADADRLLAKDKSVEGSLKHMQEEAKKKQVNGMAMLTDEEGFSIVRSYYGLAGSPVVSNKVSVPASEPDIVLNIKLRG